MTDTLAADLRRAGVSDVDDSGLARALYSSDASLYRVPPRVVVRPRHGDEIVAVRASTSTSSTRDRWRLVSTTTPGPTALPAIEVPAPRIVSGTPRERQTSSAATISSACLGRTTARGRTR